MEQFYSTSHPSDEGRERAKENYLEDLKFEVKLANKEEEWKELAVKYQDLYQLLEKDLLPKVQELARQYPKDSAEYKNSDLIKEYRQKVDELLAMRKRSDWSNFIRWTKKQGMELFGDDEKYL